VERQPVDEVDVAIIARELGIDVGRSDIERESFWLESLRECHAHWRDRAGAKLIPTQPNVHQFSSAPRLLLAPR
jgi:hypothetical protein